MAEPNELVDRLEERQPSVALTVLRACVQSGLLRRGHSWMLKALPSRVWGGSVVSVRTDLGQMSLRPSDRSAAPLLLEGRLGHEIRETDLMRRLARSSCVMIDVGAHYGWYTRLMALTAPRALVFGFEADPLTFRYLRSNVADLKNARCFNAAVGATDGEAILWRSSRSDLSSTVRRVGVPLPTPMRSLDSVLAHEGVRQVDLIKVDVEGAEVAVLRGAQRVMGTERPPVWMLEISEQFFQEAGFSSDEIMSVLQTSCPAGKFFSQDSTARPREILRLSDRTLGNNVFFVPVQRLDEFARVAAGV